MNLRAIRARALVSAPPPNLASYSGRTLWVFRCGCRVHEKVSGDLKGGFAFGWVSTMRYAANSAWPLLSMLAFNLMLMSATCTSARGEVPSPPVLHRCPVFFELLGYAHMPDLRKYGIQPARMIGAGDMWPKGSARDTVPSALEVAHGVALRPPNGGPVVLDIEHWPSRGTDAEVASTVRRLLTLLARVRQLEPAADIGYYGIPPLRDYWRAIRAPGSAPYVEWQHDNDRFQLLANAVTVLFPSLYTFYDDAEGWRRYAIANLSEAKRLGGPRPIYAFLWPQFTGSDKKLANQYLGAAFWRTQLETVAAHADGIVLWKGLEATGKRSEWDDSAAWWAETRRFIEAECGHV